MAVMRKTFLVSVSHKQKISHFYAETAPAILVPFFLMKYLLPKEKFKKRETIDSEKMSPHLQQTSHP